MLAVTSSAVIAVFSCLMKIRQMTFEEVTCPMGKVP